MKEKIKDIVSKIGTDSSGKWISIDNTEQMVRLIVDECLTAIDNTDKKSLIYTTYDQGVVEGVMTKSKESVKKHFGIDND